MSGKIEPGLSHLTQDNRSFLVSGQTGQRANGPLQVQTEDSDSDTERSLERAVRRSLQKDELHSANPDEEQGTLCYCASMICHCFCNAILSVGACFKGLWRSLLDYCGYEEPTWQSKYPLHDACDQGNIERIRELVSQGYDVNQEDERHDSPIHYLFVHHHYELIPDLIELGANVDDPDCTGKAILHKVCELDFEVVINTETKRWRSAQIGLKPNLGQDEVRLIDILIGAKPDLDAPDRRGHRPIFQAGKTGLVHRLAVAGANVNVTDSEGMTPLHHACAKGSLDRIRVLCDMKADIFAKDRLGRTPFLVYAARENFSLMGEDDDIEKIKAVIRKFELVNKLAPMVTDNDGNGAFQLAARAQNKAFVRALFYKGTQINVKDKEGRTILHEAVARGHLAFAKFLVEECHAQVNLRDNLGRSPLYVVCENPHRLPRELRQEIAQFLIDMGAAKDQNSLTTNRDPSGKKHQANINHLLDGSKKEEGKKDSIAPGIRAALALATEAERQGAGTIPDPSLVKAAQSQSDVIEADGKPDDRSTDGKTAS